MTHLDVDLKSNTYRRITVAVSYYVRRANESFSRTIARRMALMVIKKLDSEGRIWRTV
jgi:hypothetical protein